MFGNGIFSRIKQTLIPKHEVSEEKKDKRFGVVIAVFAVVIVLTGIRAIYDPEVAQQIRGLKFSAADGLILAAAAGGYCYLKKGGRK